MLRSIYQRYLELNPEKIDGLDANGNKRIVEIDESLFFRRKYNRGRLGNHDWVIGGTGRAFVTCVPNRNSQTMKQIIEKFIEPNTIIITDEWRAYRAALNIIEMSNNDMNIEHQTINHSYNFVDPTNNLVHTQNIECLWSQIKNKLRKRKGILKHEINEHLLSFLFLKKINKDKRINQTIILMCSDTYEDLNFN